MNEFERWQERYSIDDYLFGETPNYFLASCKDILPASGRALAVADGEGRNGVWLAEQGLEAAGIPVNTVARPGLGHGIDHEGLTHGGAFRKAAFAV